MAIAAIIAAAVAVTATANGAAEEARWQAPRASASSRALMEPDEMWPPPEDADIEYFQDLGNMSMPVEATASAQRFFDQGFRFIAAFDFYRSVISFRVAQRLDPSCVMCIWGEAFALGPSLNSFDEPKLVETVTIAHVRSLEALRRSEEEGGSIAERNKELIRALTLRFGKSVEDHLLQEKALALSYARKMDSIYEAFKPDANLAALAAEGWMLTNPWDYWEAPDKPRATTENAFRILREAMHWEPRHPFCAHMLVHLTEASGDLRLIQKAVPTAHLLRELMPGSPHLVHMTFHTLMHIGDYNDSAVDNARASSLPRQVYPMHNLDTLSWACRSEGRSRCSLRAAGGLRHIAMPIAEKHKFETGFPAARFAALELLTKLAFGLNEEILMAPAPLSCTDGYLCGIWRYVRGVSLAKAGHVQAARAELRALEEQQEVVAAKLLESPGWAWKNFNGSKYWGVMPVGPVLRIAELELQAAIARADQRYEDEATAYHEAWLAEAALPYDEPPTWFLPVGIRYGDALSRAGRVHAAWQVFNQTLEKYPHLGWALFGMLQLCERSNLFECAGIESGIKARFEAAWRMADVELASASEVLGPRAPAAELPQGSRWSAVPTPVSITAAVAVFALGGLAVAGLVVAVVRARRAGVRSARQCLACVGHYDRMEGDSEAGCS